MSARYEAVEMGPDDPYPGMWGVRDNKRDCWTKAGDEVDRYLMEYSAQQTAASRRYVDESRTLRAD